MEASDFTEPGLLEAWLSYKAAIKHIDEKKFTFSLEAQNYCNNLIAEHKEKCEVLERAQRIINTARAIHERGHRQSIEVMQ